MDLSGTNAPNLRAEWWSNRKALLLAVGGVELCFLNGYCKKTKSVDPTSNMDTAISAIDMPLMPTPSTSSASPSVELRHDYEVLSGTTTDRSSAHTSPEDTRTTQLKDCELCPELKNRPNNIADSLKGGRKQRSCTVVYESQISPELEGIKLKIKKSPTQDLSQTTSNPPKTKQARLKKPAVVRGRKRKKKKKGQSDDGTEDEDNEDDFVQYSEPTPDDRNRVQSMWASERMPPEILTKIFMEVTYTEGCVPTLVM